MGYTLLAVCGNTGPKHLLEQCSKEGDYELVTAKSGSRGTQLAGEISPDMILIDAHLPDINGLMCLKILKETKESRGIPTVVLCEKYSDEEMAQALDLGADDYICYTQCDPREFAARLRTVARRRLERDDHVSTALALGTVRLDPARHICIVGKRLKRLRPREFELLEILMRKAGRVLSRTYLLESIWGMSRQADTRTVDVTVSRLRQALGRRAGKWVETVERFGYRFRDPDELNT